MFDFTYHKPNSVPATIKRIMVNGMRSFILFRDCSQNHILNVAIGNIAALPDDH